MNETSRNFENCLLLGNYSDNMIKVLDLLANAYGNHSNNEVKRVLYSLDALERNIFSKESNLSYVYFIKDCNRDIVKVGRTNSIKNRIYELESSFKFCGIEPNLKILAVFVVHRELVNLAEKEFHKIFNAYHSYREWFSVDSKTLLKELNLYATNNQLKSIVESNIFYIIDNRIHKSEDLFKGLWTDEILRKRRSKLRGDNRLYNILLEEIKIQFGKNNITLETMSLEMFVENLINYYKDYSQIIYDLMVWEGQFLAEA